MNVVNFNERSCEKYRRYFDAYLDNELLVETNQDVLQHLKSCTECSRILEDRSRVKQLVRQAVSTQEAPPELLVALQGRLRRRPGFFEYDAVRWAMAAAAVALLTIVGVGTLRWTDIVKTGRDGNVLQTVSARARDLLRVGIVDHIHCAILGENWKHRVSFDAMKAATGDDALGPQFIDLVPAVTAKLGSQYQLIQAHRCSANDRQYVHLILTGQNGIILSVVITKKSNESFSRAEAVAVMKASGVPIYEDQEGTWQIAGFESDKYLAYVVSNLDRNTNLNIASVIAPLVYDHLHRLDAA